MKRYQVTICKCLNGERLVVLRKGSNDMMVGAVAAKEIAEASIPAETPDDTNIPELCIGGTAAQSQESEEKPAAQTVINSPKYYNRYSVEAVEMARRIWGDDALAKAAEITAFFYRMRAGVKPENPFEVDISKENWWLDYKREKLHQENEIKYE